MLAFGIDHVMAAEEWRCNAELLLALQNVLRSHAYAVSTHALVGVHSDCGKIFLLSSRRT
jgi:hypothetical protein